ncbi:hypothetical protein K439DRAFT_1646851 [Ramaria rubella]|nr:hypothetical protein K439DRAFT_1646851 [Ramaria rubella]
MNTLVAYTSSDDEEMQSTKNAGLKRHSEPPAASPSRKKRKLPPLPPSLKSPVSEDDPSKHLGRVRTQPHVEGQFASYVYVPVPLERKGGNDIGRLIMCIMKEAESLVPGLNFIVGEDGREELHISLSRPVYLRHHQRESFKGAVKSLASSHVSFSASFATFATFNNDDATRTFLALEVGAGHSRFRSLAEALTPTLRALYQKEYYAQPRFHASMAWMLLDSPLKTPSTSTPQPPSEVDALLSLMPSHVAPNFPTVPELPSILLPTLKERIGGRLHRRGIFDVTEIKVRIGKEVNAYPLGDH